MQLVFVAALLSLLFAAPSYATMSFPPGNSFGAVSKTSSGELVASTHYFTLDVGDQIFVHVAKDNVSSGDGDLDEIREVVDSQGNIYAKVLEWNNGQGKRQAGVVAAMFLATNTVAYPTNSLEPLSVTVRFSTNNVVAKAMVVQRVISSFPLIPVDADVLANDNANPGLMNLAVPNEEHLWVRTMGIEGAWVNFFESTDYYDWGTLGTYGGGGASNIAVAYESDVFTGTSNPSDPISINADSVSILVVFREDLP